MKPWAVLMAGLVITLVLIGCADSPARRGGGVTASPTLPGVQRGGQGQPTIVLQAGHGDGARTWRPVFDALASRHAVIAFDRPGYGAVPATAAPRDPCTIAAELHALLQRLGVAPPYLLVGHSLGGRYQWVYAALYPHEVVGLILLEPTHPDHWQRLQTEVPAMALTVKAARLAVSDTMKREFDDQDRCLAERIGPAQLEALRRIPARVLARESYALAERGGFERLHRRAMHDWLQLTSARTIDLVARSGHYLQRDRPDAVVDAVATAATAARR